MPIPSQKSLLISVMLLSPIGMAADLKNGEQLHNSQCRSCHIEMTGGDGSLLYMRDNRRVTSLKALQQRVRRCESNLELKWLDDDINDVVHYLNKTYYQFPQQ
jgi:mono/diheme cytochrome c family protein